MVAISAICQNREELTAGPTIVPAPVRVQRPADLDWEDYRDQLDEEIADHLDYWESREEELDLAAEASAVAWGLAAEVVRG